MSKIAKASSTAWQTFEGGLCAIIVGRDSVRREVSIAVPAGAFLGLAGEARRRIAAAEAKGQHIPLPPTWHHLNFLPVLTMNVGTTDNQKVGIILDQGLETEFGLSIPPEHARELGRQLIEQADRASGTTPKMN